MRILFHIALATLIWACGDSKTDATDAGDVSYSASDSDDNKDESASDQYNGAEESGVASDGDLDDLEESEASTKSDTEKNDDSESEEESESNTGFEDEPDNYEDTDADNDENIESDNSENAKDTEDGVDSDVVWERDTSSPYCQFPTSADPTDAQAAYEHWKSVLVTDEGAGGYLRPRKPDSRGTPDATVSEGIAYGMLLAVHMDDQDAFDAFWGYEQQYLNENGLMHWEIDGDGNVTGTGAATDAEEDMAWALLRAAEKWGGKGGLDDTYMDLAVELIELMWIHEVDHSRNEMIKPGDSWGDADVTNPSYFAPAYYRVFARVTGNDGWIDAVDTAYDILERSLNQASGNQNNGLVPPWCDSSGAVVAPFDGAPTHYQGDSSRTPFRIGQDYCYNGEPRAKAYLEKITGFFDQIGVVNITDGYELDGTPAPDRAVDGKLPASFIGPAAVGAMYDGEHPLFVDEAYEALATLEMNGGSTYYQKSWNALSLLMLTGLWMNLE